jgi:hypothetical protein
MSFFNQFRKIEFNQLSYWVASFFFTVYAVFAVVYFKERCIYIDSAFQLFKIINFENFNFEAHRYGVVFSQFLPLLAIKFALPLKYVLIAFSLSFVLLGYLVFLLCYHVLHEKKVAFIIPVSLISGIAQGFFYTVTEIYQASLFVVLFYAWQNVNVLKINTLKNEIFSLVISFVLFLLCFLCHPSAIFAIVFIVFYLKIRNKAGLNIQTIMLLLSFVLVALIKLFLTGSTSYEGNIFSDFLNSPALILNVFSLYPANFFKNNFMFGIYFIPSLMLVFLLLTYLFKKQYQLFIYVTLAVCLYWCILVLTFYKGDDDIVMEKTFALWLLFIIIPFANDIFYNNVFKKTIAVLLFIVIIVVGFLFVNDSGLLYKRRLIYIQSLLDKTTVNVCSKRIINKTDLHGIVRIPWAVSVETLLLSALNNPEQQQTIFIADETMVLDKVDLTDSTLFLLTPFYLQFNTPLNQKYFKLDNCAYQWIKKEDLWLKSENSKQAIDLLQFVDLNEASVYNLRSVYGLTYANKACALTSKTHFELVVKANIFINDQIDEGDLFLVFTQTSGKKMLMYKAIDLSNDLVYNQWTLIEKGIELVTVIPSDKLKVYFWSPNRKSCYISEAFLIIKE